MKWRMGRRHRGESWRYLVPVDMLNLKLLIHLDLSSNMLRSIPPELGNMISLRFLLLHNNFLRSLPPELGRLFQLVVLTVSNNPLAGELRDIVKTGDTSQLLDYLLNKLNDPKIELPLRSWLPLRFPQSAKATAIFTVMTYNVLSAKIASRQLYGYCPSSALNWEYRKREILDRNILRQHTDIICLQEVVMEEFDSFFSPELRKEGYDGIFAPKSRAKTMEEKLARDVDGCAIFYQSNKFSLVQHRVVEFNQLVMEKVKQNGVEGSSDLLNRVMTKDNIGLVAIFQFKQPPKTCDRPLQIMVANVHNHWDPEHCDVKLIQTILFMNELYNISSTVPLVLCGDMNSLPESGAIDFVLNGSVSFNHQDFKGILYDRCLKGAFLRDHGEGDDQSESLEATQQSESLDATHQSEPLDASNQTVLHQSEATEANHQSVTSVVTHPFRLQSAYDLRDPNVGYTNYTFEFKVIIDYIFYSTPCMRSLGILELIHPRWFQDNNIVGCPNSGVPSDHFPLVTELEMLTTPPEVVEQEK